jgi:hypothetical protein
MIGMLDQLAYELGSAAAFDLAGFNGRPLGDDVVDVMLNWRQIGSSGTALPLIGVSPTS